MSDWRTGAACTNHDPDLWWRVGNKGIDTVALNAPAIAICRACPVLAQCAADDATLGVTETWGIRAALTQDQRRQAKRDAEQTERVEHKRVVRERSRVRVREYAKAGRIAMGARRAS